MDGDNPTICFISIGAYTYFEPDTDFPPGGAERQLYLIGQELKNKFDVHFVVGDFGQPTTQFRDGILLHRAYKPTTGTPFYRRPVQLTQLLLAMRGADADIYIFRGDHIRAIITYALTNLLGKQWVYNLALDSHAELDTGRLVDPLQYGIQMALSNADHIITQTEYQRNQLTKSIDVNSTVVPNGYPSLSEIPSTDDDEFFLYVGRINREQKRTHRFLNLAQRVPETEFMLIGPNGGDNKYYEQIVAQAHKLDNVTFRGEVEPENVHTYFKQAIALVNTSAEEGFPNTFLEAWRAETPVISLDVDPGRFLDGPSEGYAAGDFDQLVSLAKHLADSRERRRSIGKRERQYFERNYHISIVANKYATALQSCYDCNNTGGDK